MKIEQPCATSIDPTKAPGHLRPTLYLLFLVVAAIAFASAHGELRSTRLNNELPATIIVVTNTNDSGPGSLRQALVEANDGDTINFDPVLVAQTITLTSGELTVDKDVTISGPGALFLTVDGNGNGSVFHINLGNSVTISGLTITNGDAVSGGGIHSDGSALTVSNCIISGNSGGGIHNDGGFLTVSNCTISGNSGIGISNLAFGSGFQFATVTNSTVSGNSAGGISNSGSQGGSATLGVSNSTLSGNQSTGISNGAFSSGAFPSSSAYATVTNCTLSGNSASDGGGIHNSAGSSGVGSLAVVTIRNSTLSGNSASHLGGGIYNSQGFAASAGVSIEDTILNAGPLGENIYNSSGTVSSLGYNLSSDSGSGYLTGPGDQINTDAMLGALQDNGGPTFTHALLPGSPAIDTGNPNPTSPPDYDQRGLGFPRIVNNRLDIGSFEIQSEPITLSAVGRKVGGVNTVRLTWSGATSTDIDVYRDAMLIVTTSNDGSYTDSTGDTGRARYTYQICEAGTEICSDIARVRFRH